MNNKSNLSRIGAALAVLALTACKPVVLSPTGDVAAQQRDVLITATLLMLIVIIPVMALTVYFAWKYRASNTSADYRPDWDHSTKLELVIWAVPLLIIICLGAVTWVGTHLLDPYRPLGRISADTPRTEAHQELRVDVVALDWKWLFIYPEQGIATVNQLAVPVDRPVEFRLTSSTVMNAFYIPDMAGMIYAMPAMETTLHGVLNQEGTFQGLASHYSGAGFSGMRFKTHAMQPADFDRWVAEISAGDQRLDRAAYLKLEHPSENVPPMQFASVDPELFSRVVNMCVEEGKMCMAEMMALDREGGIGMAGTINTAALPGAETMRRGTGFPVLGQDPRMVVTMCTPEQSTAMFGERLASLPVPKDNTPLRGRGLDRPEGLFTLPTPNELTGIAPDAGVDRNL